MITWKKSGRCLPSTCVEIAEVDGLWHYRQTDNPSAVIQYTTDQHTEITDEILGNTPKGTSQLVEWLDLGGMVLHPAPGDDTDYTLVYDRAEVDAYRAGLQTDDFQPVPTLTPPGETT